VLSFTASAVEPAGAQTYRVKGVLRANGISRTTEALVHSPVGHTPFLVLTLSLEPASFAELWEELEGRALVSAAQKEMRPRAWLRVPELAAA
jgi:hypothetical protein